MLRELAAARRGVWPIGAFLILLRGEGTRVNHKKLRWLYCGLQIVTLGRQLRQARVDIKEAVCPK